MIDRVFYNPVESYSRGHPLYPSEISTLQPPHPLGISIDHPWGGGYGYFLESHNVEIWLVFHVFLFPDFLEVFFSELQIIFRIEKINCISAKVVYTTLSLSQGCIYNKYYSHLLKVYFFLLFVDTVIYGK